MHSIQTLRPLCIRLAVAFVFAVVSLLAKARAEEPIATDSPLTEQLFVEADSSKIDIDSLYAKILALEEAELKRTTEELKKKSESEKAPKTWSERSKEKWTVKLGGHVQIDSINWADASPSIVAAPPIPGPENYVSFRRLRLVADGTGYGVYDFRLQITLEPETVGDSQGGNTTANIKDAYVSVNEIPGFGRMRLGHFFVPFSLEQVTNDTNNIFLERSIPTQGIFAADREIGVAFYN